jgi:hypothetical protein
MERTVCMGLLVDVFLRSDVLEEYRMELPPDAIG